MDSSPTDLASSRVVATTAALGVLAAGIAFLLYRFGGKAQGYYVDRSGPNIHHMVASLEGGMGAGALCRHKYLVQPAARTPE